MFGPGIRAVILTAKNPEVMNSSEDLERFYVEYESEWVPRGMTLQAYCSRNNVPYRVLDKYVKDIRKKVYEVRIEGVPEEVPASSQMNDPSSASQSVAEVVKSNKRISVLIRMSDGTEVSRRGLDYVGLKSLIEKLEVLC